MDTYLILAKLKSRLNKLDSADTDNIQCWQYIEAFNKAQRDWCRRQLHGGNQYKEGSEQSVRRVDDLQILLKTKTLRGSNIQNYFESEVLPIDYMEYNRVVVKAFTETCKSKTLKVNFVEEANVDELLFDWSTEPSFEWAETFHTILDNKLKIYTKNFGIKEVSLVYYKQPEDISFADCENFEGKQFGTINPEFKDDIVEVLIDEALTILAADVESFNIYQTAEKRKELNN